MLKELRLVVFVLSFSLISIAAVGCKPDTINFSAPATTATLKNVAVTPAQANMAPGSTLQLEATGTLSNGVVRGVTNEVTWKSLSPENVTVSGAGLVTSLPTSSGTTTITATSGSLTASAIITFSPLASLSLSPANPAIASGTTQQFKATGDLQNGATQDLTNSVAWSSSDSSAAITGNGIATTVPGIAGTSTISALFSGVTGTTLLTTAQLKSIAVTPFTSAITHGTTQQFTATGTLANNATQNLTSFATWSAAPASIAIINNGGLAASVANGSATITANFENLSGSAVLTVKEPNVVSLSVTPASQSISPGMSQQFSAFATFSDGTFQNFTENVVWNSSNSQVAFVSNTPGTKGLTTAVTTGTTEISASLFTIQSNQVALNVISQPTTTTVTSIVITPANPTVPAGNTIQLAANSFSSNGAVMENVTATAVWHSSNSTVAFVSQGFVTTLAAGTTTITATSNGISGSIVLVVTPF